MKPYYQHQGITIYHGDCREILPTLEKVDLVLTDPPYGIGEEYKSFDDTKENLKELIDDFFPLVKEKSKRILLTPGNGNQWLYPVPDWTLCWFISAGTGRSAWGFSCWQPVLAYGKDPYLEKCLGARPDALSRTETAENWLGHPCSKPLNVWKWFLERGSAVTTDIILDPFMGSGTTLRAAKDLNRQAIGIELEEKYCEIAAKRLSQEVFDFGGVK